MAWSRATFCPRWPRRDALAHVEAALAGFREQVAGSAEDVLRALLERSGVLRGSGEDAVEFVHNTLKAFSQRSSIWGS